MESVESPFNPNEAIESRYPAHSIPNDEHGEDSIGLALELESIKIQESQEDDASQHVKSSSIPQTP